MNNLESFIKMLESANIVFTIKETSRGFSLDIVAKDGPKNDGYSGFVAAFYFDKDGKLDSVGIWE